MNAAPPQRPAQAEGDGLRPDFDEPIALIGIGCRYADARGPDEFWEIVRSGRNTVRDAPDHRVELGYDVDHFYDPRPRTPGRISSKKGGFLEHPELFDPAAFGIAPRDALTMEPQQRLMVEVTWDALEDAGIVPARLVGERVAVILGYMAEDYSRERTGVLGEEAVFRGHDVFTVGGMSHAVLSGRIAFLLGVTGPSFTLDTACSSSLIATHLACQSLRRGESKLALAGGVNLFLSPEGNIALSRSGMLSMSGACRAFDAGCDGFVRAEGAGVVVLKRLSEAVADGDPIYAVIRGSGISSDGRDGGHMMAPGRGGQAQAMRDAYQQAAIDPARVQYVETHGTGTMIGDPVEIGALADVMGPGRDPDRPLRVASVKGNLGHTESASGVAGLIKACLAIRHRELPAQLHFETPNPAIPWDEIPVRVQAETTPWPEPGPALVGVNSFGISGTNAHVVLESPPEAPRPATREEGALLLLSGHDEGSLRDMARAMSDRLRAAGPDELAGLLHTAACHRTHRTHRLTVAGRSATDFADALDGTLEEGSHPAVRRGVVSEGARPSLVMLFPGQGGQWRGMGRALLRDEPVFRAEIERIDAAYRAYVDWSLREVLEERSALDWTSRLDVLQPTLVAFEIALAALLASRGIRPDRVVGQSVGEIAAAHVAGVLALEDVARIACHRGRLVARARGAGGMAVVSLAGAEVESRLATGPGGLEIAGLNSPGTTLVSGDRDALVAWTDALEAEGVFARRLEVDFASHCFHMDPLIEPFRAALDGATPRAPRIPFHSTVDGQTDEAVALGLDYWVANLRRAVDLDGGVRRALEAGGEIFLEVSPHASLPRVIEEIARSAGRSASYLSTCSRDEADGLAVAAQVGALHCAGAAIDPEAVAPAGPVVALPLYAYQRERYWFSERTRLDRPRPTHPLLGVPSVSSLDPALRQWDLLLDADTASFVDGIRVDGERTAPTGFFVELAQAAATATWPAFEGCIRGLELHRPLVLPPGGRRQVQVTLRREGPDEGRMTVASRGPDDETWVRHATARLDATPPAGDERGRIDAPSEAGGVSLPLESFEAGLAACGVALDGAARTLRAFGREEQDVTAKLMLPRSVEAEWSAYHAHPALVEGALQLLGRLGGGDGAAIRVERIDSIWIDGGIGSDARCRARPGSPARAGGADVGFFGRDGAPTALFSGVTYCARPRIRAHASVDDGPWMRLGWRAVDPAQIPEEKTVARWVLVSDDADEAEGVAALLRKQDAECRFCEKPEDLARIARLMSAADPSPWGLLVLAWGPTAVSPDREPESHRAFRIGSWAEAFRASSTEARVVWIATRGLVAALPEDRPIALARHRVAREIEAFTDALELDRCHFFDASRELAPEERVALVACLGANERERRHAARGRQLLVQRLELDGDPGAHSDLRSAGERDFEARMERRPDGTRALVLVGRRDLAPGPGELQVEVDRVGLGEVDALASLGLTREAASGPNGVGVDYVGRVTAIGEDVRGWSLGESVAGIARDALARRRIARPERLLRVPAEADPADLAGSLAARRYARHVLVDRAGVRPGDEVLVDVGSGARAEAFVRVARALEARPVVFAGSADRDAFFAEAGARLTKGGWSERFDWIVGLARADTIQDRLDRLRPGGAFLDVTPTERTDDAELGAIRLQSGCSLTRVGDLPADDDLVGGACVTDGVEFATPAVFPVSSAERALAYLRQDRARGRVVLALADAPEAAIREGWDDSDSTGPRVRLSGAPGAALDALRRASTAIGAVVVEPANDNLASGQALDDRPDLWIHVAGEADADRGRIRARMRDDPAPRRVFVSLRAAASEEMDARHAWESLAYVDALSRPAPESGDASWVDLWLPEEGPFDSLESLVPRFAVGRPGFDPRPLVYFDPAERAAREESAIFDDLPRRTPRAAGCSPEALRALPLPERRAAAEACVREELAMVLGLDEAGRDALDAARGLDGLGLDSLMTLELFAGLARQLSLEIAPDWFDGMPSVSGIASVLAERIGGEAGG